MVADILGRTESTDDTKSIIVKTNDVKDAYRQQMQLENELMQLNSTIIEKNNLLAEKEQMIDHLAKYHILHCIMFSDFSILAGCLVIPVAVWKMSKVKLVK